MRMISQYVRVLAIALAFQSGQAWAQSGTAFSQATAATEPVAERYFAAYIAREWDSLAPLLADAGGFSDPTASLVFGEVKHVGKAATMKNFREGYAAITQMEFKRSRAFFSGEHAIFEGTLDWTLALGEGKEAITKAMPFVTILRVQNGQVVEHQDFADYAPFLSAVRAMKARN